MVVNAEAISGIYQITNITTNQTGGISTAGTYTVPLDGTVDILMYAEAGRYYSYNGGYGASAIVLKVPVTQGDIFRFVKISGAYEDEEGLAVGGSGIGLYINNVLKLVVGGGGGADTRGVRSVAGGGGYVGGLKYQTRFPGSSNSGFSIDGTRGGSVSNILSNGDGAPKEDGTSPLRELIGYGGSGYNAMTQDVEFGTNQGEGAARCEKDRAAGG